MSEAASDTESAHTTDHKSGRGQRIEIITRGERRRSWTAEEKREIAAESLEAGMSAATVARRHGIGTGQLYTWRQQLLRNAIGVAVGTAPGFARVDVVAGPPRLEVADLATPEAGPTMPPSPAPPDGRIEITLSRGVTVRVDAKVDGAALRRVLAALERS